MAFPPSLYAATGRPAPETPALDHDVTTTVAIIGAGFTGLSAALHLAERGVRPVVIDAQAPGWGASGRNGGHVNPGLKHDPDAVLRRFGAERGKALLDFSYGAPRTTFTLIERHQIRCDARQGGTLRAARTEAHAASVRDAAAQCAARGIETKLLEGADAAAAIGSDGYLCAMLDPSGGDLQPLDYARGLARAAIQAGATVHAETPAKSLRRTQDGWQIETPGGRITADQVVIATNGHTGDLWPGLRQTIVPVFSSITASEPLPPALLDKILPDRSVLWENGRLTVYARIDMAGRMVIGGRGPQKSLHGPAAMRYLVRLADERWPGLRLVPWTHGWNGQIAVTTDHYPRLHVLAPGLVTFLGCNGRGMALTTAMGAELARLLLGEETILPPSTPDMVPLHQFWRVGVAASMAASRMLDRIGY